MKILEEKQIRHKIRRLTIEILERNLQESELILAGINENGLNMAELLLQELVTRTTMAITLTRITVYSPAPTTQPIVLEMPLTEVAGKTVVLVDDVANSGRTIFYALKPLLDIAPKKVEVAVLVDRKHKSFPIQPDYVGLSLATTLQDNITVKFDDTGHMAAYLD